MALKYYTGFESDATILAADGIVLTSSPTVSTSERHRTLSGRGGDRSIQCNASADNVRIPAFTVGAAEEVALAVHHSAGAVWACTFNNSSVSENCSIRVAADGFLRIHRLSTVLATSAVPLASVTWNWFLIEVTAREAASAGRVRVFLNGSSSVFADTGAGVDCRATSIDDFASVELNCNTGTTYFDDYVQAGAGTLPDRQLFIQMIRPVSETATIEGTPSTGTDNSATIDEDPVSLTDYNEFTAGGQEDRFNMGNLGFTPIAVLAVRPMAHMTGEGTIVNGRTLVESGGSTTYGSNRALATGGTYQIVGDIFELNPNGSIAWTGSAVDALISGMEANT